MTPRDLTQYSFTKLEQIAWHRLHEALQFAWRRRNQVQASFTAVGEIGGTLISQYFGVGCLGTQPRRQIYRRTDRRVFKTRGRADHPHRNGSGRDAEADAQLQVPLRPACS